MPPRLNKRQQRELEELEALGSKSNISGSSSDEEDSKVVVCESKQASSGFSAVRRILRYFISDEL